jgi:hypothetical protein
MSPNEKLDAFIKILTIGVWPAVVVWLAWYLRDELKRVASRTVKAGLSGFEFAPPPPEQIPSPPKEGVSATSSTPQPPTPTQAGNLQSFIAGLRGFLSDEQVEPAAQRVRAELNNTFGPKPADQLEGLVYSVASLNIQLSHEKIYNAIFGSQLRLIGQMIGGGVSTEIARRIYEEVKAAFPEVYRNYTFEQWIGFLASSGLCAVGDSGTYVLTPYGRGFWKYIADRRLSLNKPF